MTRPGQVAGALALAFAGVVAGARAAAQNPPTWRLVEELRIGGDADGPANFVDIRGLAATKSGNIFVLDFKARELRVFDKAGKFLRLAARSGSGPGELSYPTGIAVGDDDNVVVSDPANARYSYFGPNGNYLKHVSSVITGYGDYWAGTMVRDRIADFPVRARVGGIDPATNYPRTEDRLRLISADGKADTVAFPACGVEPPRAVYRMESGRATSLVLPNAAIEHKVVSRRGTVWCTPSDQYVLFAGPAGGALRELVRKPVTPLPVNRADVIKFVHDFEQTVKGKLVSFDEASIPKSKPVINRLIADDQGRVWVERASLPNVAAAIDVYDENGKAVGMIAAPLRLGIRVFITGSSVYTVVSNADDVPFVVRYRIERK